MYGYGVDVGVWYVETGGYGGYGVEPDPAVAPGIGM